MITRMSLARLVPWVVHSAIEYVAAVLLIVAPFLFDFERDTAKWTSIALGVIVLLVAVITRSPLGVTKTLAVSAHATLDYVLAVVLVLVPFVLGFAGDKSAVSFFVLLGVAHAALSLLTRFPEKASA
jgi:phosphatidylserine synthase